MIPIIVVLLSSLLTACGVPQEELQNIIAQLKTSQAEQQNTDAELKAAQAQVAELQGEIKKLNAQYEIVGRTPAETAQNIVKRYHDTHVYSKYDFYVCSDMAMDVWNMLKAQQIEAVIQVGSIEKSVSTITEVDHAWVLAKISPDGYLALEATGGYAVPEQENGLYYKGWSFGSPREYKRYIEIRQEYNIRVGIIEQLNEKAKTTYKEYEKEYAYYTELVDEFNTKYVGGAVSSASKAHKEKIDTQLALAKAKEGQYSQLSEIIKEQRQELEKIAADMRGLAG